MLRNIPHALRQFALSAVLVLVVATAASAQNAVRVKSDHVTIWKAGFSTVAMTVNAGTVLEVVGRRGNWYEVVLPGPDWQGRTTGFIAVSRVEPYAGTLPGTTGGSSTVAGQRPGGAGTTPRAAAGQASGWQVFGEAAYGHFTAAKSFDAVLGTPWGPWFGGGVKYGLRSGLFFEGEVEHFQGTGERVFVDNGAVYKLGVKDTISITPVTGAVGYSVRQRAVTSYVGAGAGAYLYRETSDFADASDNVKQTNAAYRVFGGVEWPFARHYAAGFEVQYTAVPKALSAGAAAAFDERDLGGIQIKARLLFGR